MSNSLGSEVAHCIKEIMASASWSLRPRKRWGYQISALMQDDMDLCTSPHYLNYKFGIRRDITKKIANNNLPIINRRTGSQGSWGSWRSTWQRRGRRCGRMDAATYWPQPTNLGGHTPLRPFFPLVAIKYHKSRDSYDIQNHDYDHWCDDSAMRTAYVVRISGSINWRKNRNSAYFVKIRVAAFLILWAIT